MTVYEELTDEELMSLLKSNDRLAYTIIFDRYKRLLFVHAYKRLSDTENAQDVVQDVFVQLWSRRAELVIASSLRAYLYTSVRNTIFNLMARRKIESGYLDSLQNFIDHSHDFADHKVGYKQLVALIEKEISELPEKMQQVFR